MSIHDKTIESIFEEYKQWRKKTMRQFMVVTLCLAAGIYGSILFVAVMAMRYYVLR